MEGGADVCGGEFDGEWGRVGDVRVIGLQVCGEVGCGEGGVEFLDLKGGAIGLGDGGGVCDEDVDVFFEKEWFFKACDMKGAA